MNKKKRGPSRGPLLCLALYLLAASAPGKSTDAPAEPAIERFAVEVFNGPGMKSRVPLTYPASERTRGNEGWVRVNLMIDPEGKPYEVAVADSTGNAAFEAEAIRAIERTRFTPATLGKTPVHSGFAVKVKFHMRDAATGAGRSFIAAYEELTKAIEAGDRSRADAQLANLSVQNLYEYAYKNLALFSYHVKWGKERQQLEALRSAIAGEENATYLKREQFVSAVAAMLTLEIRQQDFAGALETWKQFQKIAPRKMLSDWQSTIDQVTALRTSTTPVKLSGEISKGTSWLGGLFRNRFEVATSKGSVAEIKLRCDGQYFFFRHEAGVRYKVDDRYRNCMIELIGEHGTVFDIVQS